MQLDRDKKTQQDTDKRQAHEAAEAAVKTAGQSKPPEQPRSQSPAPADATPGRPRSGPRSSAGASSGTKKDTRKRLKMPEAVKEAYVSMGHFETQHREKLPCGIKLGDVRVGEDDAIPLGWGLPSRPSCVYALIQHGCFSGTAGRSPAPTARLS